MFAYEYRPTSLKCEMLVIFSMLFSLCTLSCLVPGTSAAIGAGTETAHEAVFSHAHEEGAPCTGKCLTEAQATEAAWFGYYETAIATKTNMDADLVPGMVTILKGEDIEERGARTVGEALNFVPGMQFSIGNNGSPRVTMRGIPTGSSQKIKMMLNGVPMNASLQGEAAPLFFIPIEQVERIEVIRGPGSVLYGKWAYLGVINVVTRQKGNRIFGRFGSFESHNAGVVASYEDREGFKASLNASGWERDRSDIESGPDSLAGTGLSHAPGPVNDSREAGTGVLSMEYKKFSLVTQWTSTSFGSNYGLTGALPPLDDRRNQTERSRTVDMGWSKALSQVLELKVNAGYTSYLWDSGKLWLFPAGLVTSDDMVGNSHYEEGTAHTGINLHWTAWEGHHLLFGLEYEHVQMGEIWLKANYDPKTFEPAPYQRFGGDKNWLDEGQNRNIYSSFIQDQYKITDSITLSAGLRNDIYDDSNSNIQKSTMKLAGVYSLSENHIFKVQYAEAFRPPSFFEMYRINEPGLLANTRLDFETVKTFELGYIYKNPSLTGEITLFHSKMNDLINNVVNSNTFISSPANVDTIKSVGTEMALHWKICNPLSIDTNVSYAKTIEGETLLGEINWLGNVGLVYRPYHNGFAALSYGYAGERKRIDEDPRSNLDAYNTVDLTFGIEKLYVDGLKFRTGIKNIFDEDVLFPADYTSYPEDFAAPGREWWVGLSYQF
ncbi:MAG TPA: TonB-dependent receptor [Candidatus Brocadiaceae bacterium]|nr:TonB-dependent receptor [Candidatus Brocadiaceae bacterium]